MESKNFSKADHDNVMPHTVTIKKADNGFLLKIGCSYFVKEGEASNLTPYLTKYLNCGGGLAEELKITDNLYRAHSEDEAVMTKSEEIDEKGALSSVYSDLKGGNRTLGGPRLHLWKKY